MSIVSSESRSVGSSSEHHVTRPMINNPCFSKREVSNQVDLNPAPAPDPAVQEALWKAKSAECHACHELVPHKLLYVCRHRRCPGFFEPKLNYDEPSTFYANEKVFCSRCTFIGDHKRHADEMKEAQPIAMKMASSNEERLIAFEKLAFLDQEDPVDFMVSNEFRVTELPVLAVDKYLLYAEDVIEWKERKQNIDDLKTTVEQCRLDGSNFARECAEKALSLLEDEHLDELKKANTKRRDAVETTIEYAKLLREMWAAKKKNIAPNDFNDAIRMNSDMFECSEQHDCQEFVAFLLDQLHTSMYEANKTLHPPPPAIDPKKEEENHEIEETDEEKAERSWTEYEKQNESLVTQLFTGQLRSHFIAYAKSNEDKWLLLNDCSVREVSEEEVDKQGAYRSKLIRFELNLKMLCNKELRLGTFIIADGSSQGYFARRKRHITKSKAHEAGEEEEES
ncbi:hypothetical protein L5515_014658 [Caenorhabditis briggsae]|uniref:ubiquitinyl hydrolase 1 n=1 Tax=Caenorhabditis briggsae TaxID=6238 RepID=A0AAE9EGU8_CAEBR|nr:hypothetical protein L5515_014658 [Caenorhabditis briggsae]